MNQSPFLSHSPLLLHLSILSCNHSHPTHQVPKSPLPPPPSLLWHLFTLILSQRPHVNGVSVIPAYVISSLIPSILTIKYKKMSDQGLGGKKNIALYTTSNLWWLLEESGGVRKGARKVKTNQEDFSEVVVGLGSKFVHQCSGSSVCINIFSRLLHNWKQDESERRWGNRRTAGVMGGGAACLYSRVEEEGAKRLTMQRSSPSLTTLSSLYPFNPLPASGGSTKATSWWYSLFNIFIVLWWKDFGRYKKTTHGCTDWMKILSTINCSPWRAKGTQLHVACRERRQSFFFFFLLSHQ